jgi:hypothetical protein
VRFTVTNETDARVSYRLDGKPYPLAARRRSRSTARRAPLCTRTAASDAQSRATTASSRSSLRGGD